MMTEKYFKLNCLSEDSTYYFYRLQAYQQVWELAVPKVFDARFKRDMEWACLVNAKYGIKTEDNRPRSRYSGRIEECDRNKSGQIPLDEPFATTKYENVPSGYGTVKETDTHIFLAVMGGGLVGMWEGALAVPYAQWQRFTLDSDWRELMNRKYTIDNPADPVKAFSPDSRYGFLPEDEGVGEKWEPNSLYMPPSN